MKRNVNIETRTTSNVSYFYALVFLSVWSTSGLNPHVVNTCFRQEDPTNPRRIPFLGSVCKGVRGTRAQLGIIIFSKNI